MKRGFVIGCLSVLTAIASMIINGTAFGQDRTVFFGTEDPGISKPIDIWGADTAWLSRDNVRRSVIFMGQPQTDVIRFSFTGDWPVTLGAPLHPDAQAEFDERMSIVDAYTDSHTALYLNNDTDDWNTNPYTGVNGLDADAWAMLIEVTRSNCVAAGRAVLSVAPFNEPDHATYQGDQTRLGQICQKLRDTYGFGADGNGIRLYGGSSLNNDQAFNWYDPVKGVLDEGNTHQLAGGFDSYAAFFQYVDANGDLGLNDELHNTMEAMVGAEYGMDGGIWWGTAERTRGEFVKASDGMRLGYAEHRPNWTAASVYRGTNGVVQAFVGESERQALPTTYRFFCKDRPVFYDGHGPQRAYEVTTTGGAGYQTANHHNAETVINITWGDDVQPAIDGRYMLVNRRSLKVMEVEGASNNNDANIVQRTYGGGLNQQWDVNPMPSTSGGDYAYFSITPAHTSGKAAEVAGFSYDNGGNVVQYQIPTNSIYPGVNQQWILEYVEDGWFYIRNRWSGQYVGVQSFSKNDGANIQQQDFWPNQPTFQTAYMECQQWRLVPEGAAIEFVAPVAPTGLVATANAVSVQLSWNENTDPDLDGYTVLRSATDGGPYEIIARGLTSNTFMDNSANRTMPYYYVVRAVDQSLNHSANSDQATATPSGGPVLVAQYGFEGDSSDTSNNGNNGVVSGTAEYVPGGVGSSCLSMLGGGYVELPAEVVDFDQVTVAAWVYWNGGSEWQRIFDFGNGTDAYLHLTPKTDSGSGGTMRFVIHEGVAEDVLDAPVALTSDEWTHVAVTLSNTTAMIYVNGTNVASSSSFTLKPSDFNPVQNYIGRSQYDWDPLYKGTIDDFRLYNYALGAAEVAALADVPVTDPVVPEVVSLNVESYGTIPDGPGNTAGVVDADYWNDTWRDDGVSGGGLNGHISANLQDNSGAATTLDVTFTSANGTWNIIGNTDPGADADGTHNRRLIQGYLNNGGGATTSISLAQIPYASYDLYVYFSADAADREGSITDGTKTYYFRTIGGPSVPMPTGNAILTQSTDTVDDIQDAAANYVVFSGLSDAAKTVTCNIPSYGGIAGFQVVKKVAIPPSVPTGLAAMGEDGQVSLTWDAASYATNYTVKYAFTSGGSYMEAGRTNSTSFVHAGLTNGITYYYVVSASGEGGVSPDSDEVSAVPTGGAIDPEEYRIDGNAVIGGTNMVLTVSDSTPGLLYQMLATESLTPPDWQPEGVVVGGNGSNVVFNLPITTTNRYFKLDVQRQ